MDLPLDSSLNHSIRDHLDDFFLALQKGTPALNSFLGTLSSFSNTIRANRAKLRAETLHAANDFASIISTVSSYIMELETATEKISIKPYEISTILSRKMDTLSLSDDRRSNTPAGHPAYLKPSYQWLLSNLHNPYPSREVKKDISRQTNCSVKDIDAWFIDVRKRIGWNALRKTRFSNKQEKIVAAATSIFKPKPTSFSDDFSTTLMSEMDPNDLYRGSFITMEHNARALYADKFPDLVSLSHGYFIPHATTAPATVPIAYAGQWDSKSTAQPSQVHSSDSYPTPEASPPSFLVDESPTPTSTPLAASHMCESRKRRRPSLDFDQGNSEDIIDHVSKRLRTDTNDVNESFAATSLPSPSITDDLSDETPEGTTSPQFASEQHTVSQIPSLKRKWCLSDGESQGPAKHPYVLRISEDMETPVVSEMSKLKRKRRLSDGETRCPPKRPHNAFSQPRLQTVSNPLPVTPSSVGEPFDPCSQNDVVSDHNPDYIPSPANLEGYLSLDTPLDDGHAISAAYLNPYPEDSLSFLVTEELSASVSSESSNSCFNLFTPPCYTDTLQDPLSNIVVSTADFPDFSLLSAPEYDLSAPNGSTFFTEDLSHWLISMQSGNSCGSLELPTSNSLETSNSYVAPSHSLDAKRARLQALKEQVSQLEGQLEGQLMA